MLKTLLDLIFPKLCIGCGVAGQYICTKCLHFNLNICLAQKCHVCGREVRLGFVHKECAEYSYLDGLVYVVGYNEFAEKILAGLKYQSVYSIADELGIIVAEFIALNYNFDEFIVSYVPMHSKRKKSRGYNQSELIAKSFAKASGVQHFEILKRVVNTKNQVGLNATEREDNLRNSIEPVGKFEGQNILIFDDVYTTGATMNECAKVLKQNRAKSVIGVVFAKTGE